jgi:hypothetical protein
MNIEKQLSRIAKLGIKDFETTEEVQKLQTDLLRRLERSSLDPGEYASLADCGPNYCAHKKCREVCWFGSRRRRLEQIPTIYDLLQNSGQPLHEVRVVRGDWTRPAEDLALINIKAAKQLNRRLLERVYNPSVVAVGMFNVLKAPDWAKGGGEAWSPDYWACEIHQIVAGAAKHDLERVFSIPVRSVNPISGHDVKPVKNLGKVISAVFQRDLQIDHPWVDDGEPTTRVRRDFYTWLLILRPDDRLIRYGCDERFNKLEGKKPRRFVLSDWKKPSKREEELKLAHERRVRRFLRSKPKRRN